MTLGKRVSKTWLLAMVALGLGTGVSPAFGQATSIEGVGEACIDFMGGTYCGPLTLTFSPSGGPVTGRYATSFSVDYAGTAITAEAVIDFDGTFAGGDGGAVSGTFSGTETLTGGFGQFDLSGDWSGKFVAAGNGSGKLTGVNTTQGLPFAGTWKVAFSAQAFRAALASPTPTATARHAPTPTPTPTPRPTPDPTVQAAFQTFVASMPGYAQYLSDQIRRLEAAADSGFETFNTYVVVPWADYRLARVVLDDNGRPLAQDENGVQVPIQSDGAPLASTDEFSATLQELMQSNQEIDWLAEIAGFSEDAGGLLQRLADPSLETTEGKLDSPQLTKEFTDILSTLTEPSLDYLTGLEPWERQNMQRTILAVMSGDPIPRYSLPYPPDIADRRWYYSAKDFDNLMLQMEQVMTRDDLDPEVRGEMEKMAAMYSQGPAETMGEIDSAADTVARLLGSQEGADLFNSRQRWQLFSKVYNEIGVQGLTQMENEGRITPKMSGYVRRHIQNRWPLESGEARQLIDAYNTMMALRNQPEPPPEPTWFETLGLHFFDRVLRDRDETNATIEAVD